MTDQIRYPYLSAIEGSSKLLTPVDGTVDLATLIEAASGSIPSTAVAFSIGVPTGTVWFTMDGTEAAASASNPLSGYVGTVSMQPTEMARLKFVGSGGGEAFYITFFAQGGKD